MAWTVDISGNDITSYCQSINWHPRWGRPATLVVKMPGHLYPVSVGSEIHLYNASSDLVFSGPIWNIEPTGQPNRTDIEITAYDHLIYMTKRICKQGSDDEGYPSPFNRIELWPVFDFWISAPAIMAAFVQAALDDPNAGGSAPIPTGELPWTIGTVEFSDVSVLGVPMQTPIFLDQMRQLLMSTGQLAINVTPGIGSSILDFVVPPSTVGGASQTFEYQTGAFNSQAATYTDDMDEVVNALWYFLGPRGPRAGPTAPNRPRGIPINHWAGSITPTAANAGGDGEGGEEGTPWPSQLVARFSQSRQQYGYFEDNRIFDDNPDSQDIRELYEEMWANEAWVRAVPRRFASIKPERGVEPAFNVGNFVAMAAGSRLNGGVSGTFLVYEFEVEINVNGVVTITDIVASDDGAGAPSVG